MSKTDEEIRVTREKQLRRIEQKLDAIIKHLNECRPADNPPITTLDDDDDRPVDPG